MLNRACLVLGLAVCAVVPAFASDTCESMDAADRALSSVHSWADLRGWESKYHACDDGYLAEGVTELVASTLALRWETLPQLQAEFAESSAFRPFVLGHIDASANLDHLDAVVGHARDRCPQGYTALCESVLTAGEQALAEAHEHHSGGQQ